MAASEAPTLTRAERKKLELRQEIIETAFDCFADAGYHATGIADIAQRLGIGHGTFYRYFENKRDIVEQVITDLLDRITANLTAQNAPDAPTSLQEYRDQTARIADALTDVFASDPRIPKLLLLEATSIDAAMTERVFEFFDVAATLTGAYFQHGVDQGYLRADLDVEFSARAVNGMIMAVVLHSVRGADDAAIEAFKASVQALMYEGIVKR